LVVGDVRDPDAVATVLHGMDAVCHLAAKVDLGVDVRDLPDRAAAPWGRRWSASRRPSIPATPMRRAYKVGSGTPRTVGELAEALSRALGGPAPVITSRYRLGDVRHITADSGLLRQELGCAPAVDFASAVAEV
jgi:nucleoside-diphosphate-sugar epimerase